MQNSHVLRQGSHLVGQRRDADRKMEADSHQKNQTEEKKCRSEQGSSDQVRDPD